MPFWKRASRSDRAFFSAASTLLLLSLLLLGLRDRHLQAAGEDEEFYRFIEAAAEIYNEIGTKYVDEVEPTKVLEAGLAGMFSQLDEHSQYMSPDMLKALDKDTSGEFSGIGIHITKEQGVLTVIAPMPGSPAAEAGILPYDRIIEIEGETTQDIDLTEAVRKLTGPAGTGVTFKVWREGLQEPLEFTIKRARVSIESVFYDMVSEDIGYVRLARFSEHTSADLRRALLDMKAQGMKGLVLDLRFNTGGLLREAIEVSDMFVEKGEVIVSTRGRLANQNRVYKAMNEPLTRVPLFVLVNRGSASASEIAAGAIQDHRIGVIMGPAGQNTFGKGSVQQIINLHHSLTEDTDGNPEVSAIRLTSARYYTPSGRTIHEVGITPDIGVPVPEDHEMKLLRFGLLGDARVGSKFNQNAKVEEGDAEEISPESRVLIEGLEENQDSEAPATEETPSTEEGGAFYNVKRPDEPEAVTDILLEEAVKQLKIYMILQDGQHGTPQPVVASTTESEGVSMAPTEN